MQTLWQFFLEPVNKELVFAILIAFGIGFIIGRWIKNFRAVKLKSIVNKGDKAFFKGIRYILSNDYEQAIEEFTRSVQANSDTIETYVALGNLYRAKGDIDRAIRIRQSIILRPGIDDDIKNRALFDLGMDYHKGGFLNRALETLSKATQQAPGNVAILEEIERIYEELKEWENAYQTRQKISRLTKGNYRNILAHHSVEMGKIFCQKGEHSKAKTYFNRAISTQKGCVDAYLHLGDLHFGKQEYKKAISAWKRVVQVAPQFAFLAYRRLEGTYSKMKNLKPVERFLKDCIVSNPGVFTHLALARYLYSENDIEGALKELESALKSSPFFWEIRKFKGEILLNHGKEKEALSEYRALIDCLYMSCLRFRCEQCDFESSKLYWQCPQCNKWDTIHLIDLSGVLSTHHTEADVGVSGLSVGEKEE